MRSRWATTSTLANDGFKIWPANLVNQSGFNSIKMNALSGFGASDVVVDATGTSDGLLGPGSADASAGVDDYEWFVSLRVEDATKQMVKVQRHPFEGPGVT